MCISNDVPLKSMLVLELLLPHLLGHDGTLILLVANLRLDEWADVRLLTADVPENGGAQQDEGQEYNGVVHVGWSNRTDGLKLLDSCSYMERDEYSQEEGR